MFKNLKNRFESFLFTLANKFIRQKVNIADVQTRRFELIDTFVREIIPDALELDSPTVLHSKDKISANYFLIGDKYPEYDYIIPEVPLYIVIGGISSATWEQAQLYISREEWDNSNEYLDQLDIQTKLLATNGLTKKPLIMIIKWDEPITNLYLLGKLRKIINE